MKFHFIPILVDEFWSFFREILMIFFRISWIFSENDEMSRDFDKNCQKNAEKGRKFWNLCQISFVHFIFSILSLIMSIHVVASPWVYGHLFPGMAQGWKAAMYSVWSNETSPSLLRSWRTPQLVKLLSWRVHFPKTFSTAELIY